MAVGEQEHHAHQTQPPGRLQREYNRPTARSRLDLLPTAQGVNGESSHARGRLAMRETAADSKSPCPRKPVRDCWSCVLPWGVQPPPAGGTATTHAGTWN